MASALWGRGGPGSLDGSGVEADAEGGQGMIAVVAVGTGRGLLWVSLGRWRASVGTGSGAVGATAPGKKFSRLSLGCFGVVGVSPAACEDKGEVRMVGWAAQSLCQDICLGLGPPTRPHNAIPGPSMLPRALAALQTSVMLGNCWQPIALPWEDVWVLLVGTERRPSGWPGPPADAPLPFLGATLGGHDRRQGVIVPDVGTAVMESQSWRAISQRPLAGSSRGSWGDTKSQLPKFKTAAPKPRCRTVQLWLP